MPRSKCWVLMVASRQAWKRVCNVFLLLHVLGGYVIQINVLCSAATARLKQRATRARGDGSNNEVRDRLEWFAMSGMLLLLAFAMSNLIPFLDDMLGFIGALCSIATTYIFPCAFALALLHERMSVQERACCVLVAAVAVCLAFLGATASVISLVRDWQAGGAPAPFSC